MCIAVDVDGNILAYVNKRLISLCANLPYTPIPLGGVSTTFPNMGIKYRET